MSQSNQSVTTTGDAAIPADLTDAESQVRSYSRAWPVVFHSASGSWVRTEAGTQYLDFFSGAGTLNYGHNNPLLKGPLLAYLESDGVTHGLDMMTTAKAAFIRRFQSLILRPRALDYRIQFTGPTGTNAVEAALKLARKVTGRSTVVAFSNAFHGVSLGSLAVTASRSKRAGAGVPLGHTLHLPYDGFGRWGGRSPDLLDELLSASGSGVDVPAAVIVETVQGEGGINVASHEWLRRLAELCRRREILLIVDDVQVGCGRTGPFFSFEAADIVPDLLCLSKSISGYGLPMALLLIRPDLDVWEPGEHNGTFRGNNAAFVTAAAALESYWSDSELETCTGRSSQVVAEFLDGLARTLPGLQIRHRGRGLIWGLSFARADLAKAVCREAFARGLIVETSGANDEVVKLLPPLTVTGDELHEGLGIVAEAVRAQAQSR